jgi:hypothetical protein
MRRHICCIAAVCTVTSVVTACGGSTATRPQPGPTTRGLPSRPTAALASSRAAGAVSRTPHTGQSSVHDRPARVTAAGTRPSPRAAPAGHGRTRAERPASKAGITPSTLAAHAANPCRLVSLSEAHSLTGGAVVGAMEAPLGPTCVYRAGGSKATITLAVEPARVSQIQRQMKKRQRLIVRGRTAYCGTLGTQMLFVPVRPGEVLNVTAPCSIAKRFATVAIGRLAA